MASLNFSAGLKAFIFDNRIVVSRLLLPSHCLTIGGAFVVSY